MHSLCSEALALLFSMPLQLIFLYNYTLPLIIHIMIRHHLHVTRSCHFLSEIRMTSNNIQYAEVCTGGWTKVNARSRVLYLNREKLTLRFIVHKFAVGHCLPYIFLVSTRVHIM